MRNMKISINLSTLFLIISLVLIFNTVQTKILFDYVDKSSQEVLESQQKILDIYENTLSEQENNSTENTKYPNPFVEKADGKLSNNAIATNISIIDSKLEQNKKEKTELSTEKQVENNTQKTDLKLSQHDDLKSFKPITVEEMNKIIDQFNSIIKKSSYDCPFVGRGDVFIKASEESGLNPLYIFAHAALESDYGRSSMARNKGNYFGIGAFDSNPSNAYNIGDCFESGIINGAKWIEENFYNNNQKTLYDMQFKYSNHYYASSGQKWINDILWIANKYV